MGTHNRFVKNFLKIPNRLGKMSENRRKDFLTHTVQHGIYAIMKCPSVCLSICHTTISCAKSVPSKLSRH